MGSTLGPAIEQVNGISEAQPNDFSGWLAQSLGSAGGESSQAPAMSPVSSGLLSAGMSLINSSQPSTQPTSLGESVIGALGQGIDAFQSADALSAQQQNAIQNSLGDIGPLSIPMGQGPAVNARQQMQGAQNPFQQQLLQQAAAGGLGGGMSWS